MTTLIISPIVARLPRITREGMTRCRSASKALGVVSLEREQIVVHKRAVQI